MMTSRGSRRWAAAALTSVSATALLVGSARQADAQPFNWTGFYIGVHAGATFNDSQSRMGVPCPPVGSPPAYICNAALPLNGPVVAAAGTGRFSDERFTGGGTAGYNWLIGMLLVGVETDFGAFGLNGNRDVRSFFVQSMGCGCAPTVGDGFNVSTTVNADWLYTLRGRIGVPVNNWLFFATGGLAISDVKISSAFTDVNGANATGSSSVTKTGYTVGGGAEWMVTNRWTVKVEYLYVNLGTLNTNMVIRHPTIAAYSHAISTAVDVAAHIARVGINFGF
jgi:outer membrane immunogenic protein